jgi:Peptidase family M28
MRVLLARIAHATLLAAFAVSTVCGQGRPAMQPAGSPQPLVGLPRTHKPEPTSAAIDVRDLMTREYIIADDSMEGRDTGRRGGVKSTNYIAAELARFGLKPAGENGTFFQTVPFVIRSPDSASSLSTRGASFSIDADFLVVPRIGIQVFLGGFPYGGSFRGTDVSTIWGGTIGGKLVDPAQTRGKVVVFRLADGRSEQFWTKDDLTEYAVARAVIVDIGADRMPTAVPMRRTAVLYNDTTVHAMPVIVATPAVTQVLFDVTATAPEPGTAGHPISGHFGYVDQPTEAPTRNVVGILPGGDPALRGQYVAIGAHSDHVGFFPGGPVDHDSIRAFNAVARPRGADDRLPGNVTEAQWTHIRALIDTLHRAHGGPRLDSIMNGADDDGSGTVVALEIAEAFAKGGVRPKRSLLFVFHAAEEKGLYGAEYFADHPTVSRDSIVAQINMDQMGRGGAEDAPPAGTNAMVLIGTRRLSTELGDLAESVNRKPEYGFKFDYSFDAPGDPSSGYCRSDHYMYARYGIPVLFFVSAVWYIDYHMVSDEPQYIDYPRLAKVGNYIKDVVGEVASLPHRPAIDKAKPDPNGVCRQ